MGECCLSVQPDMFLYIVPGAPYYHDYLNVKSLYNEWRPAKMNKDVLEEKYPAILGECLLYGISVKDIHHRVFPALQTLAVKRW